jgi:hypothetical protein
MTGEVGVVDGNLLTFLYTIILCETTI